MHDPRRFGMSNSVHLVTFSSVITTDDDCFDRSDHVSQHPDSQVLRSSHWYLLSDISTHPCKYFTVVFVLNLFYSSS